ncbi:MAG TPA: UDP-N-acetylmuramate--L-alanine ligase [Flavobacteriales bacterium]|nr:UDP-N-acetylmuramate--L-alanine ligase [Flavobacteriales bacterium]
MSNKVAYFIGIGGAGMSSIARYLNKTGWHVSGYDKTETPLTDQLKQEGININFDICDSSIPEEIKTVDLLLVTTPAISSDHPHLVALKKLGHKAIKRAELLGKIIKHKNTLAISGTHGKTSTTALLAHIIDGTPQRCNAFIGGVSAETNSNLYYSPNATWNIVEADEFDRSFHHLHPTHAAISSIDPDHLDVYGSEYNFIEAFKTFASQVKEKVVIHHSIASTFNNLQNIETYGLEDCSLTHYATDLSQTSSGSSFTLSLGNGKLVIPQIQVSLMGKHNLENIVAAAALAYLAGTKKEIIISRINSFKGIYRRFQIHLNSEFKVYIDDYAHHPTELKKTIEAVRTHFPNKHLTVIFQPHLYSRTLDQMDGFVHELRKTDRLILLPIYAARENPIPGFNTQSLFEKISHPHGKTSTKNSILDNLKAHPVEILLTVGAGDISLIVPKLKKWMTMKA